MKENTPMNKLERRIYDHIIGMPNDLDPIEAGAIATVAAKICLEELEIAYRKGWSYRAANPDLPGIKGFEDFKQEIL